MNMSASAQEARQAQQQRLGQNLQRLAARVNRPTPLREGRLMRMVGMKLEAEGCDGAIGERCRVISGQTVVDTEIVGFAAHCPTGVFRDALQAGATSREKKAVTGVTGEREPYFGNASTPLFLSNLIGSSGVDIGNLDVLQTVRQAAFDQLEEALTQVELEAHTHFIEVG